MNVKADAGAGLPAFVTTYSKIDSLMHSWSDRLLPSASFRILS